MAVCKAKKVFLVLLLALVVTACSSGGGGDLPGKKVPTHPGDESLIGGDGRVTPLHGRVVFADTNLGISSFVTFKSETIFTEVGDFHVNIPQGKNEYILRTLLGEHIGEVLHDVEGRKYLRYPAFDGFSYDYFDQLLIRQSLGRTVRWETDSEIPVWIETNNPNTTTETLRIVRESFVEWEQVLNGTIRFKETTNKNHALENGIVVEFAPHEELKYSGGVAIGLCQISYWPNSATLASGHIQIAYEYQDSRSLILHEIGHCIGLHHSPEPEDVMFNTLRDRNQELTEREKNIARLLYMLPPGTFPLNQSNTMLEPIVTDQYGRARDTIPTHR